MTEEIKCSSECAYAMFAPVNRCLAPYAIDDERRNKIIGQGNACIAPKWFIKTDGGLYRRKIELEKMKLKLKG